MIGWLCATYSFLGGAVLLALIGALEALTSRHSARRSDSSAAVHRAGQVTG